MTESRQVEPCRSNTFARLVCGFTAAIVLGSISLSFAQEKGTGASKPSSVSPTKADPNDPKFAWKLSVPKPVAGPIPPLEPCRVSYTASWNNFIDVGEAYITLHPTIDLERLNEVLVMLPSTDITDIPKTCVAGSATARTKGPVKLLWKYQCDVFSIIDGAKMTPKALHFQEGAKKIGETQFFGEFASADRFRSLRVKEKDKEGTKPRSLTYRDLPTPLDLLSSILYFRRLPLDVGDEVQMVVCPNEHPYLVILTVEAHENHEVYDTDYNTIRLGIAMKKINPDGTLTEHEKFKTATVWLEKDGHRLPVEIRAEVFVGSVRVQMKSHKPLKATP